MQGVYTKGYIDLIKQYYFCTLVLEQCTNYWVQMDHHAEMMTKCHDQMDDRGLCFPKCILGCYDSRTSLTDVKKAIPEDTCPQQTLVASRCHYPNHPGPHQRHTLLQQCPPRPSLNPQVGGRYLLHYWDAVPLCSDYCKSFLLPSCVCCLQPGHTDR